MSSKLDNPQIFQEKFSKYLERDLAPEDILGIREASTNLVDKMKKDENDVGLLYGRVQSGKTSGMIMSIATAIDNKFRFFIVLTSDNVSLFEQTLGRIKSGLQNVFVIGSREVRDTAAIRNRCKEAINRSGLVIVSTKNARILGRLKDFINKLDIQDLTAVVFDDEADFGSLNSKVNKSEVSVIHNLIVDLRSRFQNAKYIQVTATPQAILLQRPGDQFKPKFVVTIAPGKGYVGGKELYNLDDPAVVRNIHRIIDDEEVDRIVSEESYEDKEFSEIPDGIKRAFGTFLVGASMKHLSDREEDKFSMLCHVSSRKSPHKSVYNLVHRLIILISGALSNEEGDEAQAVMQCLKEAYDDLIQTCSNPASFEDVIEVIKENAVAASVQIVISGGEGEDPTYDSLFNILIGGERLSRGLTIKKLLLFYYGRGTGAPKIDTKLQHSRIYGYRKQVVDAIRIFSTHELLDIFYDSYLSDDDEWNYFRDGGYERNAPVILSLGRSRRLRATRRDVVPMEYLISYYPGKAYFMNAAIPSNVKEIDDLLHEFKEEPQYQLSNYDFLKRVIKLTASENTRQRWNFDAVVQALVRLEASGVVPYIAVRRDRDIERGYRAVLDSKDNGIRADNGVILFMYRLLGNGKGWDGKPLWVPVIRFPETSKAFYFTTHEPIEDDGLDDNL